MSNLTGQTINNRYQVKSLYSLGLFTTYEVMDLMMGIPKIIKVIDHSISDDSVFMRNLKKKNSILARLAHPNIPRFYGMEKAGDMVFEVWERLEGKSLRVEIKAYNGKPLDLERVIEVIEAVCKALHFAHVQGILHCDIKPSNILIEKHGRILLTEFCITCGNKTTNTTIVGSGAPAYMAPELIRGKEPTVQSDIYSLGTVIYEMITGGLRPFTGTKASVTGRILEKIMWEKIHLSPDSPRLYNPAISLKLENVVLRSLEPDLRKRYRSVIKFREQLLKVFKEDY